jgi:hypothetical protein
MDATPLTQFCKKESEIRKEELFPLSDFTNIFVIHDRARPLTHFLQKIVESERMKLIPLPDFTNTLVIHDTMGATPLTPSS